MNQTAYEILNIKQEETEAQIQHDPKSYLQSIAYKAIQTQTARKFYDLAKDVSFNISKVPGLVADNQLTWSKDAPHYFNLWADQFGNKPLKLEYKNIQLLDKQLFGTNQTLQFSFQTSLSLNHSVNIIEKKVKMDNSQKVFGEKLITFQIPFIRTIEQFKTCFSSVDEVKLTELFNEVQFLQNSLFRAKPTENEESIDVSNIKQEIYMVLTEQLVEFYYLLVAKFNLYKPENFDIELKCEFQKCEIVYNNCIVQNYKLDKTPRLLMMNLVNGQIVGQIGESKTKNLIQGLFKKEEKE